MKKRVRSALAGSVLIAQLAACYEIVDKVEPAAPLQLPATLEPPTSENSPPIISGNPSATAIVGQIWTFTPTASDPDGDSITLQIENKPPWATFDSVSGQLSGVPLLGQSGTFEDVRISVSDGQTTSAMPAFTISVLNFDDNQGPSISGTPVTSAKEGDVYSFTPSASDPENDPLTFDIANRPPWANFINDTGQLVGIPISDDAGIHANIVISVSDGQQSAALMPFDIFVERRIAANRAPIILGTPDSEAFVDQLYTFLPSASDPDDDQLLFAVANLPSWLSFDPATGNLQGRPGSENISLYENIQIFVGDGNLTSSLPKFSINVLPSNLGAVKLSWAPPNQNTDGSSLTDLIGYKIYYGTVSESYSKEIRLDNPRTTTHVIENLPPNSYYFTVTSINGQESESHYSNEVYLTIF